MSAGCVTGQIHTQHDIMPWPAGRMDGTHPAHKDRTHHSHPLHTEDNLKTPTSTCEQTHYCAAANHTHWPLLAAAASLKVILTRHEHAGGCATPGPSHQTPGQMWLKITMQVLHNGAWNVWAPCAQRDADANTLHLQLLLLNMHQSRDVHTPVPAASPKQLQAHTCPAAA